SLCVHVTGCRGANHRERTCEFEHVIELLLIAPHTPTLVIPVLLATLCVGSNRLNVPHRIRADPHVLPSRRDDDRPYARQSLRVRHAVARRIGVGEAAPDPPSL